MKNKSILLVLITLFSLQLQAQTVRVGDVVNDAVDTVYQNDFKMIEARNGCFRLGYLKSQVELIKDNGQLRKRSQRNLKRALKKIDKGMKACRKGVAPKSLLGFIYKLFVPQTRTGRSAYKAVTKLLKAQRYNRDVDSMTYISANLVRSAEDKLIPALDNDMKETHRCLLIGQAIADTDFILKSVSDSGLRNRIVTMVKKLNNSCGTNTGSRNYESRINRLLDLLKRV